MPTDFAPRIAAAPAQAQADLHRLGFACLAPELVQSLAGSDDRLSRLAVQWDHLVPDAYLRDGGHYRHRRHASLIVPTLPSGKPQLVAHRAHWQPTTYNALHGGMERWFEPMSDALVADPAFLGLVQSLGEWFAHERAAPSWFVEAHAFRIDTQGGVGRPTPEGAHRDGVDFVAVILVNRQHVSGGETRVFESDGPRGVRFTLDQAWSALILDDTRVIHESTPIQATGEGPSHRDTLVLTFRQDGFQDPPS